MSSFRVGEREVAAAVAAFTMTTMTTMTAMSHLWRTRMVRPLCENQVAARLTASLSILTV